MVKNILHSITYYVGLVWSQSLGRLPYKEYTTQQDPVFSFTGGMKKTIPAVRLHGQRPTTYLRSTDNSLTIQGQFISFARLGLSLLLTFSVGSQLSAQCQLECNNAVQVSLNQLGLAPITPQMIMAAGTTGCNGGYTVDVLDANGASLGDELDCDYAGQTLSVLLTNTASGNNCMGSVIIRDYLPPTITCQNKYIRCNESTTPQAVGYPPVSDNCTSFANSDLVYTDNFVDLGCYTVVNGNTVTARIERTWSVTDESGNTASCVQSIWLKRVTLADVVFPANRDGFEAPALNCGANPDDFAVTGYPSANGIALNNNGSCELVVNHTDQTAPLCGGSYQILREWRVTDWCANTFMIDVQVIKVQDTQAPVITCPAALTLSTSTIACTRTVVLPATTATDNCSAVTIQPQWDFGTGYGPFNNVPKGNYIVTYKATDACNNSSSCTMQVNIVDDVPPFAICDEFTDVNLTAPGGNSVWAFTFDDGSWDNCAVDHFGVSRDGVAFSDIINFDCNDAGDTVMVQFRVWDTGGLFNTCMVQVYVNDKVNPTITCPANITLHCMENHLNTAVTGVATGADNCGPVNLTFTDSTALSACNEGTIWRKWRSTDAAGNFVQCVQTIVKHDNTPISIVFPSDTTLYTCGAVTTTAVTGNPVITGDDCENINVTSDDQIFNIAAPACYKIFRTWTVIDWCHFSASNPAAGGYWTHSQVIIVMDTVAPVITCPVTPIIPITNTTCAAIVNLGPATAVDCNTNLVITNNSLFANNSGPELDGTYPKGNHYITFTATDGCGNTSSCSVTLKVIDATPPQPICNNGLSIPLNSNGEVVVTTIMISAPSTNDNCSSLQDLALVVTPSYFNCQNLGVNLVTLTATDETGNTNFCTTTIVIQDNTGECAGPNATIAGAILTETGLPVQGVTINLQGGDIWETGSSLDGGFEFTNVPDGGNYTIVPMVDELYTNGVTTYDIVLIRKHILGIELLDSPFKLIAADVNRSGSITAYDLVQMRQVILQSLDAFPTSNSWCFVDADYVFPDPANPFSVLLPESIAINNASGMIQGMDFTGVKVGDVNNSTNAGDAGTRSEESIGELVLSLQNQQLEKEKEYVITVSSEMMKSIAGMQMALNFDPAKMSIDKIESAGLNGLDESNFGTNKMNDGLLTMSWDDPSAGAVTTGNAELFRLYITSHVEDKLNNILQLSPAVLKPEAYTTAGELMDVLIYYQDADNMDKVHLYQNYPNPFSEKTTIGFYLPASTNCKLTINDALGRTIKTLEGEYQKGYHQIHIANSDLPTSGSIYYCILETSGANIVSSKMIRQ